MLLSQQRREKVECFSCIWILRMQVKDISISIYWIFRKLDEQGKINDETGNLNIDRNRIFKIKQKKEGHKVLHDLSWYVSISWELYIKSTVRRVNFYQAPTFCWHTSFWIRDKAVLVRGVHALREIIWKVESGM